ncbi:esterase-like activity of phytase-domain-containing protein [Xylogone sp. PMI_703]|nr:esterase-like activity of phytase-domain-containing protein [Xylogone sp. PMI_703]
MLRGSSDVAKVGDIFKLFSSFSRNWKWSFLTSRDLPIFYCSSFLNNMFSLKLAAVAGLAATAAAQSVNSTLCNGKNYTYQELAGFGLIPSNAVDQFGDTIGGIGSAIALDRSKWVKLPNGSYTGVLWGLPDRGWNTEGTLNFISRVHQFDILFTPALNATVENPSGNNLFFTYKKTILLSGPDGTPTTGIDADPTGHISFPGFPDMPVATIRGDGFTSDDGPVTKHIPIDAEGIVLNPDGGFWISDEYGPFVYRFDANGKMIGAIRPPPAYIPLRNGSESFSADSPTFFSSKGEGDDVSPADNPTGRDNNHGFEGLTVSGDGKTLYVLLQAAANQEGGLNKQTQRWTRLLKYDITIPSAPRYAREYVVPLPLYNDPTAKPSKNPKVAAQSEVFHIQDGQFFVLARDSGAGHGQDVSTSVYRQIDVFDIDGATDIKGNKYDCATCAIASSDGVLDSAITPATYCPFIDYNLNEQLNRFGVHNGGDQDARLLNEKWESIGIVPVDGLIGDDDEWFVFSLSDNDFITQDGHLDFGQFNYTDGSGFNLDNQALVFKIHLPDHSRPFNRNP